MAGIGGDGGELGTTGMGIVGNPVAPYRRICSRGLAILFEGSSGACAVVFTRLPYGVPIGALDEGWADSLWDGAPLRNKVPGMPILECQLVVENEEYPCSFACALAGDGSVCIGGTGLAGELARISRCGGGSSTLD